MTPIISLAFERNEKVAEDLKLTKTSCLTTVLWSSLGTNTSELHFSVSLGDFDGGLRHQTIVVHPDLTNSAFSTS